MPELPEVETIVNQLKQRIIGKTIKKIELLDSKNIDAKISKLIDDKFISVNRRAKNIIIELQKNGYLLTHLKMTGHLHYYPSLNKTNSIPPNFEYCLIRFYLNDDSLLTFNDIRKFGFIKLLTKEQLQKELAKLGPEPLDTEFTFQTFKNHLLKKKRSNLKTTLMDQNVIAGIGNIYAQEILYHAKISPLRKIDSLSESELKNIYQKIIEILTLAVQKRGSTIDNYTHIEGSGGYQHLLLVYQRDRCPLGHDLKKIELGQRGTSYCPVCQK